MFADNWNDKREGRLREKKQIKKKEELWREDCLKWRGVILTGKYSHWCFDWDELPIDETCREWPCGCGEVAKVD